MSAITGKSAAAIKQDRILALTNALAEHITKDPSHPSLRGQHTRRIKVIESLVTQANDRVRQYSVLVDHGMATDSARVILLDQALEFVESAHVLFEAWHRADVKARLHVVR